MAGVEVNVERAGSRDPRESGYHRMDHQILGSCGVEGCTDNQELKKKKKRVREEM